jgi:CDP-diacylglycerol---serine O-phosphatidyltransferase
MELRPRGTGLQRPGMRRVVVVMPSAFTLGNLFFGFWAIISAYNGNFRWAGWFIVFAGILDVLDGRIARLAKTSSRFGEELDSLIDLVSFGVAPALIMYFLEFSSAGKFAWVLCWIYVVAAAIRLARFNVVAAGKPSAWFTGIPSPAAGITLACYYPFSQTPWYRASIAWLDLQHQGLVLLMLVMAVLMVSNVKYPKMPGFSFRTVRQGLVTVLVLGCMVAALVKPDVVLFPLGLAYALFGVLRSGFLGLMERPELEPQPQPDEIAPSDIPSLTRERRERRKEQE